MSELPRPKLPSNLPVPTDDGACAHLPGMHLPDVQLKSASGSMVAMANVRDLTVIYIYPMSGPDDSGLPEGWDMTPGARGCSPQACDFRDHAQELSAFGATVFGVSTQSPATLASEAKRLHLPFDLLSDENLVFQQALQLPLFDVLAAGRRVLKRVTLICREARIVHVFYPVFPPDHSGRQVVEWLQNQSASKPSGVEEGAAFA